LQKDFGSKEKRNIHGIDFLVESNRNRNCQVRGELQDKAGYSTNL
jgi:hypothetical protein